MIVESPDPGCAGRISTDGMTQLLASRTVARRQSVGLSIGVFLGVCAASERDEQQQDYQIAHGWICDHAPKNDCYKPRRRTFKGG